MAGSGYRAMVAAAAETPEPESGMGTGSGLGWQRADVARMLVADQPDLRCTSPCAVSGRNLYKTVHHQSDAAATRPGDKEHCLQWRHGAMTTANPTHRRYPITSTTPDREGAQPSAEVTSSPRVNLTSGSGVAVTSDRGYHQCGHPRPRPG